MDNNLKKELFDNKWINNKPSDKQIEEDVQIMIDLFRNKIYHGPLPDEDELDKLFKV